jgi:hypothetical protein
MKWDAMQGVEHRDIPSNSAVRLGAFQSLAIVEYIGYYNTERCNSSLSCKIHRHRHELPGRMSARLAAQVRACADGIVLKRVHGRRRRWTVTPGDFRSFVPLITILLGSGE